MTPVRSYQIGSHAAEWRLIKTARRSMQIGAFLMAAIAAKRER